MMMMIMMRRVCDVIKPNEQRLRASYTFTFLKVILTSGRQSKAPFICCYYSIAFLGSFSLFIPSAIQPYTYHQLSLLFSFPSFCLFIGLSKFKHFIYTKIKRRRRTPTETSEDSLYSLFICFSTLRLLQHQHHIIIIIFL